MKPQDLCALICAYNEEATIADIIQRTKPQVGKVFVLDDGSRDNTYQQAITAGATVISHVKNYGKGQALKTGFHYLENQGYRAVISLDADGQHLPEEIPRFAEALDQYDIVIGRRDFRDPQVPRIRSFSNTLYARLLSRITGKPVYDPECGFRAIRTEALEALDVSCTKKGFSYESESLIKLLRNPLLKIGWVDISTIYIPGRKSKIKPVKHTIDSAKVVLRCLADRARI